MSRSYKVKKFLSKYAIKNLMLIIVIGQGSVFLMDLFFPAYGVSDYLWLSMPEVFSGQLWRLVSFVFVPEYSTLYAVAISLYFYYIIGTNLEKIWDALKFNLYYLLGVLGAIISALIAGYGTNGYINLSLFLAFAILVPDFEITLFFVLNVKIKWLALIAAGYYVVMMVLNPWDIPAIIISLVNVGIFFWRDLIKRLKTATQYQKTRNNYNSQMREWERNQKNYRQNNIRRPDEVRDYERENHNDNDPQNYS
jgi:Uncharacterized membrane protein (homolog of Drosophila rhomboid)